MAQPTGTVTFLFTDIEGSGDDHARQVIASLDAMDDFLQSGWPANAWAAGGPEKLAELGHLLAAATWLGACLTCGIPRLGSGVLRQELQSACDGGGDPELRRAIANGAALPFAELRQFTETMLANI